MSPPKNSAAANGVLLVGALLIVSMIQTTRSSDTQTEGNQLRKSIVFDLKTPKVFYCPQEKFADSDQMIVKARPLDKLCEFNGATKPRGSSSDCYDDVDETEFACDEKRRFMIRLDLAGEPEGMASRGDVGGADHTITKETSGARKKAPASGKKY